MGKNVVYVIEGKWPRHKDFLVCAVRTCFTEAHREKREWMATPNNEQAKFRVKRYVSEVK